MYTLSEEGQHKMLFKQFFLFLFLWLKVFCKITLWVGSRREWVDHGRRSCYCYQKETTNLQCLQHQFLVQNSVQSLHLIASGLRLKVCWGQDEWAQDEWGENNGECDDPRDLHGIRLSHFVGLQWEGEKWLIYYDFTMDDFMGFALDDCH